MSEIDSDAAGASTAAARATAGFPSRTAVGTRAKVPVANVADASELERQQLEERALHARLVQGALARDARAREALALLLRPHAYRLALQLLRNHEDALDCAQESLLRFFTHLESYDPRQPLLPWVRRIVRNRAIDMLRRRKVRRAASIETSGPEGEALEFADESVTEPTDALQLEQRRRLVWGCLGRLGTAHREILVLRDYQDLTYNEIATLLAIPTGTVMSRLHRARAELRRLVASEISTTAEPEA